MGSCSNGRALALHARGTGIDTQILHFFSAVKESFLFLQVVERVLASFEYGRKRWIY